MTKKEGKNNVRGDFMNSKKEMIAMLLAGGQGNRLYVLTKAIAKPGVPFGGKYKIIDFTLSNCVNSGIDTVGVLTQYQPLELNSYIGNGQPWDLDRMWGGVRILPPYTAGKTGQWYMGTANAIYQNINYVDQYNPQYVLVLSGDHIYKMDYGKMLCFHKEKGADLTIAVLDVPKEEANRFGIMNTKNDGLIYEFEEKPENPKSTNASMGVYIFNWDKLKKYLIEDEENPNSTKDFGKDIIPMMLEAKEKLYAYSFNGYWKDVGTIESLWEGNMDMLLNTKNFNISDKSWRIYSRHMPLMPQYIGDTATIRNSMIAEGSNIFGSIKSSVIFANVTVGENSKIDSSVVMDDVTIGEDVTINYAIIADGCTIEKGAVIGESPKKPSQKRIAVIGRGATVKAGQVIKPGEMIEPVY